MGLPINLTRKGYSRLIEAKKMVMLSYISTIKLTKQVLFSGVCVCGGGGRGRGGF